MSQKALYQIPNERRIAKFIGRESILTEINETFAVVESRARSTPVSLCLTGMGGIGKTQVALEFCRRAYQKRSFQLIFWIHAQSPGSIMASFDKICQWFGIPAQETLGRHARTDAALSFLNESVTPYLLVYDNFDDPKFDDFLRYVPSSGSGALLITSRLRETAQLVDTSISLDVMTKEESLDLLRACSGLTLNSGNTNKDGYIVVDYLGYLPLAIHQAGAYIRGNNGTLPFDTFIEHYQSMKDEVLKKLPKFWQYQAGSEEFEKMRRLSVYTTWELSLQLLGSDAYNQQKKMHFLTLAAFLGGNRVSRVFFKNSSSSSLNDYSMEMGIFQRASRFDDKLYKDVIIELHNLSLITGFSETELGSLHFSIHNMVREWLVLRPQDEQRKSYARNALACMTDLFEEFQDGILPRPNVSRILTFDVTRIVNNETMGLLINEMVIEIINHTQACIFHGKEYSLLPTDSGIFELFAVSFLSAVSLLGTSGHLESALDLCKLVADRYEGDPGRKGEYMIFGPYLIVCKLSKLLQIEITIHQRKSCGKGRQNGTLNGAQ